MCMLHTLTRLSLEGRCIALHGSCRHCCYHLPLGLSDRSECNPPPLYAEVAVTRRVDQ
jgi:hypothetical protein